MANFIEDQEHNIRLALWSEGKTDDEIALERYCTRQNIVKWRKRHSLKANKKVRSEA